ncbi:MAG: hypothetical protein H8M99_11565 [Gloeobacteraceae cyanobacterium ES-bin-144]|nr:hypothetical protein [Verrucomicrobiales bacterium]
MSNHHHTQECYREFAEYEYNAQRERLHARTSELAFLAGRQPLEISQCDYEQAKREDVKKYFSSL